ncbi:DUF262 domain-containing protein [Pseudomonas protegens]|uniref:DUF262 domain-containing protein n=2 Tax=Pseudomonas protegens TaxID=380021 RepID=A0A7G7XL18_9PSED|nr:DUF262 domain-containing protein [Pseudomonas protegens]QNL08932.1 DUF262 domain-containing protein [Pseudomonas protegens]
MIIQSDFNFPKSPEEQEILDSDIQEKQKITDHEIREFPVSVIVEKFKDGLDKDEAELYIPDYQREFIWSDAQQSKFIESILLNLPIPYLFVADIGQGKYEGRLEIVDGSQRIRTLVRFTDNDLMLAGLKKLTSANGFKFSDFSKPRQLRFMRKTLRMIELTELADEETRREIFDRLNSGGTKLNTMESRRGSHDGPFLDFIDELAKNPLFHELCPISRSRSERAEYQELVLRLFAYSDNYLGFDKEVDAFLTEYLISKNESFDEDRLRNEFDSMLIFVKKHFQYGFRKNAANSTVPRIRFEAISVGVVLALREQPDLVPADPSPWLNSQEFITHTRSDASNSRPKVRNRINFVRDNLLGKVAFEDSAP